VPYEGSDVYKPSEWVLRVVGSVLQSYDWTGKVEGPVFYECDGYDPRHGFWLRNLRDPEDVRNVSERAIDRTFHTIHSYSPYRKLVDALLAIKKGPKCFGSEADAVLFRSSEGGDPFNLAEFEEVNRDSPVNADDLNRMFDLKVGESVLFGGGAAAEINITRVR